MFDQEYINKLFDFAYETARNGYPWTKYSPFFEPESIVQAQQKRGLARISPKG